MGKAYTRARELCQQVGETPQLFPVLCGLCAFYLNRAELQTARELGEQLLRLAQSVQDPALLSGLTWRWGALVLAWRVCLCPDHFEQAIALYDPQQHPRSTVALRARTLGWFAYPVQPMILWSLGYPDQALKRSHEALTLAQELSHPFSLAMP